MGGNAGRAMDDDGLDRVETTTNMSAAEMAEVLLSLD